MEKPTVEEVEKVINWLNTTSLTVLNLYSAEIQITSHLLKKAKLSLEEKQHMFVCTCCNNMFEVNNVDIDKHSISNCPYCGVIAKETFLGNTTEIIERCTVSKG
jgi:Zn finger protein HypA/HybF involved in hydrogenase expression